MATIRDSYCYVRFVFVLCLCGLLSCANGDRDREEVHVVEDIAFADKKGIVAFATAIRTPTGMVKDKGGVVILDAAGKRAYLDCGGQVTKVCFSDDASLLACGEIETGRVTVWDTAKKIVVNELRNDGMVSGLEFLSKNQLVISSMGGDENKRGIWIWDLAKKADKVARVSALNAASLAVSERHPFAVLGIAGEPTGKVAVLDLSAMRPAHFLPTKRLNELVVAISPDESLVASSGTGRVINVWNRATGKVHATLDGHTGWVKSIRFSDDSALLWSAGTEGTIICWDLKARKQISCLATGGALDAACLSATYAIVERRGIVSFWELRTGKATKHVDLNAR